MSRVQIPSPAPIFKRPYGTFFYFPLLTKESLLIISVPMKDKTLQILNTSVFLQTQIFLLPVLFLFYQSCGLGVGDYFLFQGVFAFSALLFEVPAGVLADAISKRSVLILSYSLFIARLVLWLFFARWGYWILLTGEILYAAQKATFSGIADSYIFEYLKLKKIPGQMNSRYGKMNFFMSIGTAFSSLVGAYIYKSVSDWSLVKYGTDYGFVVLISMELILNLSALALLFFLPKIPATYKQKKSLKQIYSDLFRTVKWTMTNKKSRMTYHIIYSGLLVAMTSVFVWSFQPIMKLLLVPVSLFGVVYFVNHLLRALSSLCLGKIMRILSIKDLAVFSFIMFAGCFALTFVFLNVTALPVYISLLYFIFISVAIGVALAFSLSSISRIHGLISVNMRATISSISSGTGRLCSAFFFVLLKILMDGVSMQNSFAVCALIFLLGLYPLKKICDCK